jgi:hypothetical protein
VRNVAKPWLPQVNVYMYAVLTEPKMGTAVNRYGGKDRQ